MSIRDPLSHVARMSCFITVEVHSHFPFNLFIFITLTLSTRGLLEDFDAILCGKLVEAQ